MAERHQGRVVRVEVTGSECRSKERMLDLLLAEMDGVTAHHYDQTTRTLVAYVDDITADEDSLKRALVTSGMYPLRATSIGDPIEGDLNAC